MAKTVERLGEEAWVEAAMRALGRGGVEAVKVEPLAAHLGVTKGSFYWHFKDRLALLEAVFTAWERQATANVIAFVDAKHDSPHERLKTLMALTTTRDSHAGVEQAIRAWGAVDRALRARLARVDATREGYVRDLLIAAGLSRARATARARLIYLALIGEYTWVSHGGARSNRSLWTELYRLMIVR